MNGFNVGNQVEIYNIAANRWIQGQSMNTRRFSHSICDVGNGKYLYAFGGQDENLKALKTIERTVFMNENNPEESMSMWEVLELQLPQAICNVGCLPISRSEILLFGGISVGQQESQALKDGRVLMCLEDQHDLLEQAIDIAAGDSFPNTMQFVMSTEASHPDKKLIFVQGKTSVHRLDITDPSQRAFSLEFEFQP